MERAELVAHARASIERGSKSFFAASRLFDPVTRERAWLLYAWCRACDDIADGQDHGGTMAASEMARPGGPIARQREIERRTAHALASGGSGADPAFDGLALVARECGIARHFIDDLIAGFAMDAQGWAPDTADDLLRYCYHVAGSVGCMMAMVMGVAAHDDAMLDRACDLGLAFQLTNIARDVTEDAAAGRCYLPAQWLLDHGIDRDGLLDGHTRSGLAALTGRLAQMARGFEDSARLGTGALPFRSAWAVLAATGIYGGIARKVEQRGPLALDVRVMTGRMEKLGWIVRAGWQSAGRTKIYPLAARNADLWTRPRKS